MWSISTSEAAVQVLPSTGLYQLPDMAVQALFTWTLVPSRFRTYSRVLQLPSTASQWGNLSRSYLPSSYEALTVREASWLFAAEAEGMPGCAYVSRDSLLHHTRYMSAPLTGDGAGMGTAETAATSKEPTMMNFIFSMFLGR